MFIDSLIEKIREKNNPSVVGLDTLLEYVPVKIVEEAFKNHGKNMKGASEAILEFNKGIIDNVFDIVPAVKLQLACYEMYGVDGMTAFDKTARYASEKGLIVIADGKRNDIGSSAACYSSAYLGKTKIGDMEEAAFKIDALTVNPYLGIDGVQPFVNDCVKYGKGIFVLVKTSNKSSGQIQDIVSEHGLSIYENVAELLTEWGKPVIGKYGYSSVGAVVGATYPNQAKVLRSRMKSVFVLVPGFGAQGGSAKDVVHSFDKNGEGAIVNASRSIMCAHSSEAWKGKYTEAEFAQAARAEAERMRDELNGVLGK